MTETAEMDDKVNLAEKIGLLARWCSPGIVGYLNDYKLAVVKVLGEFVWHKHDDTDDFFLVLSGRMTVQLRDRDIELTAEEMLVVPRGVEHCPKADEEAHVLLIEPKGTANTGDAGGEFTAPEVEI
jgi:mannose-6-phosphate isomerase-like protein (cupin superfamily)